MTEQSKRRRRRAVLVAKILAVAAALATAGFLFAQRQSDGPLNAIIPGGPLRAGTRVDATDVDWATVLAGGGACVNGECSPMQPVELQLVDPPRSRFTGIMLHEGQLYVPCDLGFMWGRFSGSQRRVLHLIYLFKRWHEDAERDGRVVLRIEGKLYERQAVRVTDPALDAKLRLQLEEMARQWVAPEPLAEAPTEAPNDIWFFRMDPRASL